MQYIVVYPPLTAEQAEKSATSLLDGAFFCLFWAQG